MEYSSNRTTSRERILGGTARGASAFLDVDTPKSRCNTEIRFIIQGAESLDESR